MICYLTLIRFFSEKKSDIRRKLYGNYKSFYNILSLNSVGRQMPFKQNVVRNSVEAKYSCWKCVSVEHFYVLVIIHMKSFKLAA
jgi:hypothetical protein